MTTIRPSRLDDAESIWTLYRAVAAAPNGLARRVDEISLDYVHGFLIKALNGGVSLVAVDEAGAIRAEIHASRIGPAQFAHVLSDITVAVHPQAQGKGLARALFEAMFDAAKSLTPAVTRFELMVREGNTHAIRLYERMGFKIEGRFEKRVRLDDGTLEDDVVMGIVVKSGIARAL